MKSRFVLPTFTALVAFALVVSAGALAGCPGPTFVVQQYKGPQRTTASIAILRMNGTDATRLLILDDEDVAAPLERDSRLHIEVLPGKHSLVVVNAANNERSPVIAFQADAGKVYRPAFAPDGTAHVYEVNRSSDALGPDVSVQNVEPLAPTRVLPPVRAVTPDVRGDEDAGTADAAF